jgi:hypothetical protein
MKTFHAFFFFCFLTGSLSAADLAPSMQTALDAQKKVIAAWAADPVLVASVKTQNEKGPIAGMDNAAWKKLPPGDPIVQGFQTNAAGVWLAEKIKAGGGLFTEAFLNGAKGEKAAFAQKTTSYFHIGTQKFDVPMSGKPWQGVPEFDESSQTQAVQISVPVLDNGRPIGVLVVGISTRQADS